MKAILPSFLFIFLVACSSPNSLSKDQNSNELAEGTPTPSPTPPKKEPIFRCRIMNGEGRTFDGSGETRDEAERVARRECESYYRHCSLIRCWEEEQE